MSVVVCRVQLQGNSGGSNLNARIRTFIDEERTEHCEKVSHHELQVFRAEEERRIPQAESWRQQMDFRRFTNKIFLRWRNYENSKVPLSIRSHDYFIEDQNTILELSRRVQELQNEVNCMNNSKDFQDADSVRSGNSHVTSRPMLFPKHPLCEGLLRPSFISPRRTDGPPNIWDTSGLSGNVFAHPQASSSAPYPQELNSTWRKTIEEPIHMSTAEKSGRPGRDQDLKCQFDRQPNIQSSSVEEETLQRIVGQTNNDCRFRISILTSSPRQQL